MTLTLNTHIIIYLRLLNSLSAPTYFQVEGCNGMFYVSYRNAQVTNFDFGMK